MMIVGSIELYTRTKDTLAELHNAANVLSDDIVKLRTATSVLGRHESPGLMAGITILADSLEARVAALNSRIRCIECTMGLLYHMTLVGRAPHGWICDIVTGRAIRPATQTERRRSFDMPYPMYGKGNGCTILVNDVANAVRVLDSPTPT